MLKTLDKCEPLYESRTRRAPNTSFDNIYIQQFISNNNVA